MKAVFVREKMAKHYIGEFGLFSMINRSIPGIVLCKILLTFVTEVSPELIDGFGADDSPDAPNEKETDGAVSDLVSEPVETASVVPEMTKKK